MMVQIEATDRWRETFPGGHVGVLLVGNVDNTASGAALDERKRAVESRLRHKYGDFSRADLLELPILQAYRDYYKQFDKTYHVQLQLESVVHKGKKLPAVSPLVDANFAAELETLVLTAGHDAGLLVDPVTIDGTRGGESFTQLTGRVSTLKPDDMMMSDGGGIVCTILYGQDRRTAISRSTRRALYVAYAPAGVPLGAVQQQLDAIRDNVRLFAPEVVTERMEIFAANPPDASTVVR